MWRASDSLQMAMILPLTNVTLEGVIDILYYVLNKYSNKAFSCKSEDAIIEEDGILTLNVTHEPFNNNFKQYGMER
jgi:hypothetical protein